MATSLRPDEPFTRASSPPVRERPVAGQVVAERFRVGRTLGEGGMGVVVEAVHLFTGVTVALKMVSSRSELRPHDASRLLLEARHIGQLRSPHIVQVLDAGPLPDGLAYIAMERLHGETLRERLTREPHLPVADVLAIGQQLAEALIVAHAAGIIHRDLKPSNIFLVDGPSLTPTLKVLDFGIAKAPNGGEATTGSGEVFGSPGYMSPEQLRGTAAVDVRTDIWSLGVTLYEALAGRRPFEAPSATGLALAIATESPPALRSLRSDTPPDLAALIHACLARSPGDRPASASASRDRLVAIASVPTAVAAGGSSPPTIREPGLTALARRGGLVAALLIAALTLALSVGLTGRVGESLATTAGHAPDPAPLAPGLSSPSPDERGAALDPTSVAPTAPASGAPPALVSAWSPADPAALSPADPPAALPPASASTAVVSLRSPQVASLGPPPLAAVPDSARSVAETSARGGSASGASGVGSPDPRAARLPRIRD